MARWTNDRWLSTPHRVINPPLPDHPPGAASGAAHEAAGGAAGWATAAARSMPARTSLAYFCNINMDARVECIAPG